MSFPQEIWWLVAERMCRRRDISSLFNLALVSQSMASLALPFLYRLVSLYHLRTAESRMSDHLQHLRVLCHQHG